jgi:multidrug efflux pump
LYELEMDIEEIIAPYREMGIIKSVLSTVGVGNEQFESGSVPNKALTTVSFVEYELRQGIVTSEIMRDMSDQLLNRIPG